MLGRTAMASIRRENHGINRYCGYIGSSRSPEGPVTVPGRAGFGNVEARRESGLAYPPSRRIAKRPAAAGRLVDWLRPRPQDQRRCSIYHHRPDPNLEPDRRRNRFDRDRSIERTNTGKGNDIASSGTYIHSCFRLGSPTQSKRAPIDRPRSTDAHIQSRGLAPVRC